MTSAGRLVGHGNDPDDVIAVFDQPFEAFDGKVGSAHIYDTQVFLIHDDVFLVL